MATRLEAMLLERAELAASLARHRAAARAARRAATDAVAAQAREWILNAYQRRVALVAYVSAGYDAEAGAKYLEIQGQRRGWERKSEADLSRMVEDVFLEQEDFAELAGLCDTNAPTDESAMRDAVSYVEQWRLVAWARGRAASPVGAPPTTAKVLRQAEENRLRLPAAIRPPSLGSVHEVRARMWVHRWRERWGGHFGKVPTREPLCVEEARVKVSQNRQQVDYRSCAATDHPRKVRLHVPGLAPFCFPGARHWAMYSILVSGVGRRALNRVRKASRISGSLSEP